MSKQPGDPAERLGRQIQEALQKQTALLAKHTRQLESLETKKLDRVLELLLDETIEFEEELDDEFEVEGEPSLDELMAEIDKLSPEELKQQMAEAIAIIAAEREDEDEDENENEP